MIHQIKDILFPEIIENYFDIDIFNLVEMLTSNHDKDEVENHVGFLTSNKNGVLGVPKLCEKYSKGGYKYNYIGNQRVGTGESEKNSVFDFKKEAFINIHKKET